MLKAPGIGAGFASFDSVRRAGRTRARRAPRHVQEEDRAPAPRLDHGGAEGRAMPPAAAPTRPRSPRRRGCAHGGSPEHEGERGRDEGGGPGGLEHPSDHQEGGGGGQTAQRRPGAEQCGRRHEGALAADPVGEAAGGDEQDREGDRVGVQHPRQRRGADPGEVLPQVRVGHVERRGVEEDEEHGHAGHGEDLAGGGALETLIARIRSVANVSPAPRSCSARRTRTARSPRTGQPVQGSQSSSSRDARARPSPSCRSAATGRAVDVGPALSADVEARSSRAGARCTTPSTRRIRRPSKRATSRVSTTTRRRGG